MLGEEEVLVQEILSSWDVPEQDEVEGGAASWQGSHYVITFIDYLTKWVELFPTDNQTSETIVRLMVDHVICRHGELVLDRGANLRSALMKEVC